MKETAREAILETDNARQWRFTMSSGLLFVAGIHTWYLRDL